MVPSENVWENGTMSQKLVLSDKKLGLTVDHGEKLNECQQLCDADRECLSFQFDVYGKRCKYFNTQLEGDGAHRGLCYKKIVQETEVQEGPINVLAKVQEKSYCSQHIKLYDNITTAEECAEIVNSNTECPTNAGGLFIHS